MKKSSFAALVAATLLGAAAGAGAEEQRPTFSFGPEGPNFTFGAATSFVFDINQPDDQVTHENQKLYADGESEESFNIDLVQLGLSGSRGRVSYGTKIDFGDWADKVADNIDDIVALQEMFLTVDTGPVLLTAGRMPTPIGYEVLEPWANPNISRSRAWFYQPISHDGAAIAGEWHGVNMMAAVANGFGVAESDGGANNPDDEYAVIASIGTSFSTNELRLSAIYSDESDEVRVFELNALLAGTHKPFRYGFEGTWRDGDEHGPVPVVPPDSTVLDATGYAGATWGHWSADMRLSYTDQEATNDNLFNANHDGIVSFTLTGGFEIVEGVVLRAEYRIDKADNDIFDDHNSTGPDTDPSSATPEGQTDLINVVQVQLMWTPATGLH